MKIHALITLFYLTTLPIHLAAQEANYFIEYSFTSIKDTSTFKYSDADYYLLYKRQDKSRFLTEAKYYNDSMDAIFIQKYPSPEKSEFTSQSELQEWIDKFDNHIKRNHHKSRSNYYVEKDLNSRSSINFVMNTFPKSYLEEEINLKWDIHNDTTIIIGLECVKATCTYGGRNYTAWFAPSIKINDGPYIFRGLPGLIVKIEDADNWYSFKATSINLQPPKKFWKESLLHGSYFAMTRKQYISLMHKEFFDPNAPFGVVHNKEIWKEELRLKNRKRLDLVIER